jgi:chemotaxis protein MotB
MGSIRNRQFQVAGHTDSVPTRTAKFGSNWELSTARALEVVHFLEQANVGRRVLSAAGYSDVDPVAPNDTIEGKRKNRRTAITLQPAIDELVHVPEL